MLSYDFIPSKVIIDIDILKTVTQWTSKCYVSIPNIGFTLLGLVKDTL